MSDYISVEKALDLVKEQTRSLYVCCPTKIADGIRESLYKSLRNNADKDAVHVIRCRNCKWCINKDFQTNSGHCNCLERDVFANDVEAFEAVSLDDYCSYGEI